MEDETDLRIYISVLMRHWRLIVAATLLAGVVALTVSLLIPAKYEATSVVLVTRPFYQFQFSSEIQNLSAQGSLNGKAALDLASSDAVLQQLLLEVSDDLPADQARIVSISKNARSQSWR